MNNNLHLQIVKEYELYIPQFENGIYVNYIPHDLTNGYLIYVLLFIRSICALSCSTSTCLDFVESL